MCVYNSYLRFTHLNVEAVNPYIRVIKLHVTKFIDHLLSYVYLGTATYEKVISKKMSLNTFIYELVILLRC